MLTFTFVLNFKIDSPKVLYEYINIRKKSNDIIKWIRTVSTSNLHTEWKENKHKNLYANMKRDKIEPSHFT